MKNDEEAIKNATFGTRLANDSTPEISLRINSLSLSLSLSLARARARRKGGDDLL